MKRFKESLCSRHWTLCFRSLMDLICGCEQKERVASKWNDVKVVDLQVSDALNNSNAVNGMKYEAMVKLDTAGLGKDLGVELVVFSTENNENRLKAVYPLKAVAESGDIVTYEIKNEMKDAGAYRYSFRIYPNNKDLPHRQDFAYVKWI